MENIIQADIFFFITSISVIIITALALVVLIYLIKILRDILYISKKAKDESDKISKDVDYLRRSIKRSGDRMKNLVEAFLKVLGVYKKDSKIKKKSKKNGKEKK